MFRYTEPYLGAEAVYQVTGSATYPAVGLVGGYRFNRHIAVDGALGLEVGGPTAERNGGLYKTKHTLTAAASVIGLQPVSRQTDLLLRLGAQHWRSGRDRKAGQGPQDVSSYGVGAVIGVGMLHRFRHRPARVHVEYRLQQRSTEKYGAAWVHGIVARATF